jgi:hypothetical protein
MSLVNHYGRTDPRTVEAYLKLSEARADVAEAEARRLREEANLLAAENPVAVAS